MDVFGKILMSCVLIALAIIFWYRYEEYLLRQNFLVNAFVPCNPSLGTCFISDCSPEDDPSCDTEPYMKATLPANEAPLCVLNHTCNSFSCDGLASCEITTCDDSSIEDGETCQSVEPEQTASTTDEATTTTP